MTNDILSTNVLPEPLRRLIATERFRVSQIDGEVRLTPIMEKPDCTVGFRGMFADFPEMSLDKFMERKHADKELDL